MTLRTTKEPRIEFFFAFVDGAYDYVCAECTALCCKGHGLSGSLERELRPLFVRYPQLESMAMSRTGGQVTIATTSSGCVLLDTDNLCRIEKEIGKDKKPNICNLFPFNSFSRIGKTIVVMPHFLCPLRAMVPAQPGNVRGTHALIEKDLLASRMLDKAYVKRFVSRARLHASLTEASAIERERSFRELCSSALGIDRFMDALMKASTDAPGLASFVQRARLILGYESASGAQGRDALDDLLLTFATPYRIGLLDLPDEGALRALAVAELIVRRAWATASITPTLQAVAGTVSTFRAIQRLLGSGDDRFDFGRVTRKAFSFDDAELTFAAFIATHNSIEKGVLSSLEEAMPASMTVSDRSVLLMRLGEQMDATKAKQKRKHGAVIDNILSTQDGDVAKVAVSI